MSSIPEPGRTAVGDLLDECARVGPGQEVLIVAYEDGLRGGDNFVDEQAIAWIEAGVRERDANATVLWTDERSTLHHWRFPPIVKAAMAASDVMINNTLDLSFEELDGIQALHVGPEEVDGAELRHHSIASRDRLGADTPPIGQRDPLPGGDPHPAGGPLPSDRCERHPSRG